MGERFDSEMADGRSGGHDVLEDVAGVGTDVDRHVARLHDPSNSRNREDVVVPVRTRLIPEVDEDVILADGRGRIGSSAAVGYG